MKRKSHHSRGTTFVYQKGITLITLVITIILMLILAGVVLNITIGENGLFKIAKQAVQKYTVEEIRERIEIEIANIIAKETALGNDITIGNVLQELLDNETFESIDKKEHIGNIEEYEVKLKQNDDGSIVIEGVEKATGIRMTYTLNPKGYTNVEQVSILFKVQGKVNKIAKPDGLIVYPTKDSVALDYPVDKNGTYLFIVENTEGISIEEQVIVDTIDRLPPKEFTITLNNKIDGFIINGETKDQEKNDEYVCSGIDRYEYIVINSAGQEIKFETNEITGLNAGTYTIYARAYDKAGNSITSNRVTGQCEEWIKVYNEKDLRNIANYPSRNYILMNDIELTNQWTMIDRLYGKLNGNGYKISGLKVTYLNPNGAGMFKHIHGKVYDLEIEGEVTGNIEYRGVGILAVSNRGTIENVKVYGNIKSTGTKTTQSVGGLVQSNTGIIDKCYSKVNIISNGNDMTYIGGLVGTNPGGTIKRSVSEGTIYGSRYVGGLVGTNGPDGNGNGLGTIENSYSTGKIIATDSSAHDIGGLVGENKKDRSIGVVKNSYSTVDMTLVTGSYIGGLIGNNKGSVQNSYWSSEIAGISGNGIGTNLTLEQMKTQSSYVGFDFENIWVMKEYPKLNFKL